jgi:tetratricopeptide (TPR) repeat protein
MLCGEVERHLGKILNSETFCGLTCLQMFLRYVVTEELAGRGDRIKETAIAMAVYRRGIRFDPKCDSIVRVEAFKLRNALEQYYRLEGHDDTCIISIPKGQYVPEFRENGPMRDPLPIDVEELCSRGHQLVRNAGPQAIADAQERFWKAIRLAPRAAIPYAGLAESFAVGMAQEILDPLVSIPYLRMATAAALQLDSEHSDVMLCAAIVAGVADQDLSRAFNYLRRALTLNPDNAIAHLWCGGFLSLGGQYDEAFRQMERAVSLEPGSLYFRTSLALCRYFTKTPRRTRDELIKVLEIDPTYPQAHFFTGLAYTHSGHHDEAIHHMKLGGNTRPDAPLSVAHLTYAQATAGRVEEAEAGLELLTSMPEGSYVPASRVALIHMALNRPDDAAKEIQTAMRRQDTGLFWVRNYPKMDTLFERMYPKLAPLCEQHFMYTQLKRDHSALLCDAKDSRSAGDANSGNSTL